MKLKTILDRDLGGDLRSILALLAMVNAGTTIVQDEMTTRGTFTIGGLGLVGILTIIGRWTKLGDQTPAPADD